MFRKGPQAKKRNKDGSSTFKYGVRKDSEFPSHAADAAD
jgi:hypothetical protein